MENTKTSPITRILLFVASALMFAALAVPMWQIQLDAPQYPEGLVLKLYPHKIGGDVEIINGLNHYIGMKTLHTENFPEFDIIPYLLALFGLVTLLVAIFPNRKRITALFVSLMVFAAVAAADFYRWNYQYGHDLDPNAAIQVPGMAYQPPVIGYKQLLNFAAYSIPDTGGWMLITAGALLFACVFIARGYHRKFRRKTASAAAVTAILLTSCAPEGSVAISLNKDNCESCKMTISDGKFAAETITRKGRVYKFDDVSCMVQYARENSQHEYKSFYVGDYTKENDLIPAENSHFLKGGSINSPMRGNIAAFSSKEDAETYNQQLNASPMSWEQIFNSYK